MFKRQLSDCRPPFTYVNYGQPLADFFLLWRISSERRSRPRNYRLEWDRCSWHKHGVGDGGDSSVSAGFPATRWSLVLAAGNSKSSAAAEAMEGLCQLYWKPVYGYIRASGHPREDALDLTQGFFTHLIDGDVIRRADQKRGRFRSFILAWLESVLARELL